jgi:colicin import membrane protein
MRRVQPHELASEWGPDFTVGIGVSALLHVALAALIVWAASHMPVRAPLEAYTVELTDPSALGGRLAFGPLDKPLGRPRRIADAAGGAPVGTPSPGESVGSETAKPAKGIEPRKPVAQAKVAQAPKLVESETPVDSVTAITPPRPAEAPKQEDVPKPTPAPPKPVAAAKPPEADATLSRKSTPPEASKLATPAPKLKAEPRPEPEAVPQTTPTVPPPPPQAVVSTTVPTPTTIPEPATTPEPQPPDLKEAARPKVGAAGPVTAHPVPAIPKAATPVPEAAPRKTEKQPDGAADGARTAPAKPLAALPHPEGGVIAKPAPDMTAKANGGAGSGGSAETPPEDDYAAAAERWRSRMAGGMGGMAGAEHQQGTVGDGSNATGGGGTIVGFEYLSYRQRITNLIKRNWANAVRRAGLVAVVRFDLAPDGTVSGVELVSSSGDKNYDQSVVRAVQRSSPLPPPPERYREEFRQVDVDFHSEELGGQGAG